MLEVRRDWKRICRMLRVGWIVRVDWSVLRKGFLVGSSIFIFFFFLEKKILSDEGKFGIVSIKLLLLILIQSKVWCLLTNRKRKMKNNGAIVS